MTKAEAAKVAVGERLALFNYYTVSSIDSEYVHCEDENGNSVRIGRKIVDNSMVSTTQFSETKKVTRTRLAQIIEQLGHLPFAVCFTKKVEPNAIADALDPKELGSQAKRRKIVKQLMEGEERVMHCKLQRSIEDDPLMELGRYKVIDLENSKPHHPALRLVDTRTIKWLVVDGVKFEV